MPDVEFLMLDEAFGKISNPLQMWIIGVQEFNIKHQKSSIRN